MTLSKDSMRIAEKVIRTLINIEPIPSPSQGVELLAKALDYYADERLEDAARLADEIDIEINHYCVECDCEEIVGTKAYDVAVAIRKIKSGAKDE